MYCRLFVNITLILFVWSLSGCHGPPIDAIPVPPIGLAAVPGPQSNPTFIPETDHELLWNHIVDTIDDYFRIDREQRVRFIDGVLTEGRIDTFAETGSTVLEPWKQDSTPGFESWHATLQSIRRRAVIRVIPDQGGYHVEVVVFKELEDLDHPEFSTVGAATLRHDGSIVRAEDTTSLEPSTLGWIPMGRDLSLEQTIIADLRARMLNVVDG